MSTKPTYPWFFFFRIIRLVLIVFLPTLFLVLFLYRSSYKSGLVSQMTMQGEEELRLLSHTISKTNTNWKSWCQEIPPLKDVEYSLITDDGTVICDSFSSQLIGKKLKDIPKLNAGITSDLKESEEFKTLALISTMSVGDNLTLRKVVPISSLRDNMDRFDRVLFLRIVPFSALSYLVFIILFYFTTKPMGVIFSKLEKFKDELPFKRTLRHFYANNEWAAIEEALNKADQKLETQIAEVKAENAKNTTILESISDSIIAIDRFETILFFNSKFKNDFIKDTSTKQIIPKLWQVFSDETVLESFRNVLKTGNPESLKSFIFTDSLRADRFFDLTITPLRSSTGNITGALGVLHDVTEFKLAEQMRVDFIANVSHEIRTPLTSVRGYTQLLQSQSAKIDSNLHVFLDKIISNSERMISLFNDLLNLSVLESKNLKMVEDFDLAPMIEAVAGNIKTNYPDKEVTIDQDVQLVSINGDQRLMEQVLTNLIDNACKYSGTDPLHIKVSTYKKDNKGYITVSDNGPGISKEHIQRIFERFYRVDSSREVSRGTGLGLSIVKHIINKHHGKIWAESEGRGTTFFIELPLV